MPGTACDHSSVETVGIMSPHPSPGSLRGPEDIVWSSSVFAVSPSGGSKFQIQL